MPTSPVLTVKDMATTPADFCSCGGKIVNQAGKGVCKNCGTLYILYN